MTAKCFIFGQQWKKFQHLMTSEGDLTMIIDENTQVPTEKREQGKDRAARARRENKPGTLAGWLAAFAGLLLCAASPALSSGTAQDNSSGDGGIIALRLGDDDAKAMFEALAARHGTHIGCDDQEEVAFSDSLLCRHWQSRPARTICYAKFSIQSAEAVAFGDSDVLRPCLPEDVIVGVGHGDLGIIGLPSDISE